MSSSNLRFKEVERLAKILDSKHQIHGKGNFPIIEVEPRTLIQVNMFYNFFNFIFLKFRTSKIKSKHGSNIVGIFNSMIFNYSTE